MKEVLIGMATSFGPFAGLLLVGLIFGTMSERKHLASLIAREADLGDLIVTNITSSDGHEPQLVTGSTVIAYDFFRRIAIGFRKLIGGRFRMHEVMMLRARREAVLRMAEAAKAQGAHAVHNVRLITSNLGNSGDAAGGCEVLAYGTAVKLTPLSAPAQAAQPNAKEA